MIGRDSSIRVAADRFLRRQCVGTSDRVVGKSERDLAIAGPARARARGARAPSRRSVPTDRSHHAPLRRLARPARGASGGRRHPGRTRRGNCGRSTPIYRATYSGLLKVFFDLLPQDALARKVAIPIATGGGPSHLLAVDHGLRPLLASVGALVVATGVYGTDAQFRAGVPEPALVERIERAALEAASLASGVTT